MKKQINFTQLTDSVMSSLQSLSRKNQSSKKVNQVLEIGSQCFIYRGLRFSVDNKTFSVRSIKVDRDEYLTIYRFNGRRDIKSYYYKTSLLLNKQIDTFCKLCIDELESSR